MATAMPDNDAYTDVVELCALLQCVGFSVKSVDRDDGNASQEGARTVVINCPTSGVHVVLENPSLFCSCPASSPHNSGVWEVSGVTGGKHLEKEVGCGLMRSLPKQQRDRLAADLKEMIRCIRQHHESDCETPINKSASVTDLKTPEKLLQELEAGTPTRYRSLDTLTSKTSKESELPTPGTLQRALPPGCANKENNSKMCGRQGTYTLSSTPGDSSGTRRKNKTSSPIQLPCTNVLDILSAALRANEEVHSKLTTAIQKLNDEIRDDSSMSSLALDVSKISVLKGESSKSQFASSPNISIKAGIENLSKNRPKCASSSNLNQKLDTKESAFSRLRRISPKIFKKESNVKSETEKSLDEKTKLRSLLKQRTAIPVNHKSTLTAASPNLSRNKYAHIKSTIPRSVKKE